MKGHYNLIVILGPTASGKTALAARLARDLGSEVISADSRQVYRGMNIGTGKDLDEFIIDGTSVPYHLIDIVDPRHEFSVFEYQKRFYRVFSEVRERGIVPVLTGGTGLYLESVISGYRMAEVPQDHALRERLESERMESLRARLMACNPELHNTTDLTDRKRLIRAIEIAEYTRDHGSGDDEERPAIFPFITGVRWGRPLLLERIRTRLMQRLEEGMIEEVRSLHESGIGWEKLDFFGLEYRYIGAYLQGALDYDAMVRTLNAKINQFSKRQMTWFRRMEKKGTAIHWIEGSDYQSLRDLVRVHCEATGTAYPAS